MQELQNFEQWRAAVQAAVETAIYMLGGLALMCGVIGALVVYIFRSHKEYTAERFKGVDERCDKCAEHNTAEHAKLHGRLDEHIRDHANKK
jgi:hypothetical protein